MFLCFSITFWVKGEKGIVCGRLRVLKVRKGVTRTCFVIIGKELLHVKEKEGFPSAANRLILVFGLINRCKGTNISCWSWMVKVER